LTTLPFGILPSGDAGFDWANGILVGNTLNRRLSLPFRFAIMTVLRKERQMQSFVFNDAIRFKLATQQDDTGAKIQVFFGVFIGVLLRWIIIDLIKNQLPVNLSVIIARIVVALIVTIFVFSGYWQKVKEQPAGMRFLNSLVYGVSIDALVGPWTY
jgi:hypothetical protein